MTVRDYYDFTHDLDRKALASLQAIPGFNKALKAFMRGVSDRQVHMMNMASKVLLTPNQLPRVYNLLTPICDRFGIEVPPIYLEFDPTMNAYTRGDNIPDITVTSGLLENMTDEEIQIVLAHECGHIVCHHVLYQTMGDMILSGAAALLNIPLLGDGLQAAFMYWMRCAEFSADRAAALFCGNPKKVANVMFRLAGATEKIESETNLDAFISQAASYKDYMGDSGWNKFLNFTMIAYNSHPWLAVRASEIMAWGQQPDFAAVCKGLDEGAGKTTISAAEAVKNTCPRCGFINTAGSSFCRGCGLQLAPVAAQSQPRFCMNCGAPVEGAASFCMKCGAPIAAPQVVAPPAQKASSTDKIRASLINAANGAQNVASDAAQKIQNL